MEHEQETPQMINNMPKDKVARAQATAKQHAAAVAAASKHTQFESGEDGSDRLVEGEWKEVSDATATALLESNQKPRRLR